MEKIKKIAIASARKAGKILAKEFKNFDRSTVKLKSHHEVVTKADLASEKAIIKDIKANFPDHSILSEEKGKDKQDSDYIWIVDPLDGTTNFTIHNPLWSVSIGVAYKNKVVLGVVYAPYLDELYVAEKGGGAWRNKQKIKVSSISKGKVINTFCHGSTIRDIKIALKYMRQQKTKELDCRQLGSAAIELAFVASGRVESIMIPGANSWDVAAGVLLVREAGGRVTDFKGKEWTLKSRDILASNKKIHSSILKLL